jgi:hypothetical protein
MLEGMFGLLRPVAMTTARQYNTPLPCTLPLLLAPPSLLPPAAGGIIEVVVAAYVTMKPCSGNTVVGLIKVKVT